MTDYCSTTDVKGYMPEGIGAGSSTDYDFMLGEMVTAASRFIDQYIGAWPNYFSPSTDTETRYFDGNKKVEIDVDHIAALTSVAVSEEGELSSSDYTAWTLDTDYFTWPYNSTGLVEPISRLIVDINGDKINWTRFRKAVRVVARFGYSTSVPEVIKQACVAQTGRWYMRAKQAWQDGGANVEIGKMTFVKQLDPDIKQILNPWKLGGMW